MSALELAPATTARDRQDARLLILDVDRGVAWATGFPSLPKALDPGDLLVFNDAATLPASLFGTALGAPIELRLAGTSPRGYWGVLFGAGDWHQRTEDRPAPPRLEVGARLDLEGLEAQVLAVDPKSPRLVELAFGLAEDALWAALYARGRPIQYAYHQRTLALWSVQTAYGAKPVAFEMPSAGRAFTGSLLLGLRRRGVELAWLTHAAGLSSTGDAALDQRLPFPERFEIPSATSEKLVRARAEGRRVVAVGTSVVRALEGSARLGLRSGVTDLRIGPGYHPLVVTDLLTGMHVPSESHYELLHAFASAEQLRRANRVAAEHGFLSHEFGDLTLIRHGR